MRLFAPFALFSLVALAASAPKLAHVQSVYILPMGSQMDQYLATRLTQLGLIQVVADPQAADAILTDRLGESFEKKLDELYPKPKDEDEDEDAVDEKASNDSAQFRTSSFGRGKGTFFLVDRKSRNVVWSIYSRPKNSSSDELNRTAGKIADRLKHDLKPAAPAGN